MLVVTPHDIFDWEPVVQGLDQWRQDETVLALVAQTTQEKTMIQLHSRNVRVVENRNFVIHICEKSLRIVNVRADGEADHYAEFTGFPTLRAALLKFFQTFPQPRTEIKVSTGVFRMFATEDGFGDKPNAIVHTPRGSVVEVTPELEPFFEGMQRLDEGSIMFNLTDDEVKTINMAVADPQEE